LRGKLDAATGCPPHALPLQAILFASRYPISLPVANLTLALGIGYAFITTTLRIILQ
jgi:hypothetical protein